ncbi:MAG: lytic transglycosylase domain-containing protein [Oscillospiraceae bacterium]|nr:lytic transglycosylase domain-containing protein [Oscillospiraceae bacterium]
MPGGRRGTALILFPLLALAILGGWLLAEHWGQVGYPRRYSELVEQNAAAFDLPEALLYALVRTESGFKPRAVSSADARGLTQITPETFDWLQTKTGETLPLEALFQEEVSLRYGAFFLRMLLDEFGETPTALAAYHAGRGAVNGWLRDPALSPDGVSLARIPYPDTERYVEKVMRAMEKYKK